MSDSSISPPRRSARATRRHFTNLAALSLATAAMLFGVFWLVWILFTTVVNGASALNLKLVTEMGVRHRTGRIARFVARTRNRTTQLPVPIDLDQLIACKPLILL